MKAIYYAVLTIALVACASPATVKQKAPAAEIDAAMLRYKLCLSPYAPKLDDKTSDANTIAMAMVGLCDAEYEEIFEALTRTDNTAVKAKLHHEKPSIEQSMALEVVLRNRARLKAPSPP